MKKCFKVAYSEEIINDFGDNHNITPNQKSLLAQIHSLFCNKLF